MRTVVAADPRVASDEPWRVALPSTWTVPSAIRPLAHDVSPSAPRGLVPSLLAPVEGYPDAPELRWPSIVEDEPEVEPTWTTTSAVAAAAPAPPPPPPVSLPLIKQDWSLPPAPVSRRPGTDVAIESVLVQHEGIDVAPEPELGRQGRREPIERAEPTPHRRLVGDAAMVEPRRLLSDQPAETAPASFIHPRPVEPADVARQAHMLEQPLEVASAAIEHLGVSVTSDWRPPAVPAALPDIAEPSPSLHALPTQEPVSFLAPRTEHDPVGDVERVVVGQPADPVERVVTRTVDRLVPTPIERPSRPTIGERLRTHDFRIRPVAPELEASPERPVLPTFFDSHEEPRALPTPFADEPTETTQFSPSLELPGMPSDLAWSPSSDGDAESESFVWDARAVMQVRAPDDETEGPEPVQTVADPPTVPGLARPAITPALDGFAVRPPRRRRALQVGIPTPKTRPEVEPAPELRPLGPARDMWMDDDDEPTPSEVADESPIGSQEREGQSSTRGADSSTPRAADQDQLADDLYDRIRGRLRQELLIDRERSLLLTDLR